uniref:Endonuclease/exonuclease/phosphatase domain-containing protein n=1 Tax=Zonotrichia albicollis TaxID=44394 RepID=A0A8D2M205_ZONAL
MGTVTLELSLLTVALLLCPATAMLRIGAFNIQSFGDTKMSNKEVPLDMPKPIQDGPSHVIVLTLCLCSASTSQYDYEISGPLGRENYKEMYLFIYRTDVVSVVDTYQYEDPQDVFSREPFILRVSAPSTKVKEFVLVPLHSAPHDAVAEIDALYDVYLAIINKWGTDNMMFLGDFNADCSYVQPSDWSSIRLRTSDIFKWLIPDSADTTVGKSDCAYDRSVLPPRHHCPLPWHHCPLPWHPSTPLPVCIASRGRSGTHHPPPSPLQDRGVWQQAEEKKGRRRKIMALPRVPSPPP